MYAIAPNAAPLFSAGWAKASMHHSEFFVLSRLFFDMWSALWPVVMTQRRRVAFKGEGQYHARHKLPYMARIRQTHGAANSSPSLCMITSTTNIAQAGHGRGYKVRGRVA